MPFAASQGVAYAALPTAESDIFTQQIVPSDARTELVRQFFHKYSSPLEPYAQNIIEAADTYHLDFRLLPAIAMQESNLCAKAPAGSYNCWGYGIYDGKVTKFENYQQAIDKVTKTLANDYKTQGLETPTDIVRKYTPSDTGKWVNSVSYFLNQLQ